MNKIMKLTYWFNVIAWIGFWGYISAIALQDIPASEFAILYKLIMGATCLIAALHAFSVARFIEKWINEPNTVQKTIKMC